MAVTQQRISLEEFLALPEQGPALEYMGGVVSQKVSPQGQHSRLASSVIERLNRFCEPRRLALAFVELRTTFGGESRVPDVAVYRWERIPLTPDGKIANVFREPPDIAIEIASPEQSVAELARKCAWYVENGAPLALLLLPADETLRLFRTDSPVLVLRGADRVDLDDILPGFRVNVAEIFAALRLD